MPWISCGTISTCLAPASGRAPSRPVERASHRRREPVRHRDPSESSDQTRVAPFPATADLLPASPLPARSQEIRVGRGLRIGRYQLLERIGRGRQADVWRALQTDPVVEEVALKVLNASSSDPRRRAQLRREAERCARLDDPALLPVHEFGEVDGMLFMAMPFIDGCTLAHIIAQRRLIRDGRSGADAHRLAQASDEDYIRGMIELMACVARGAAGAHAIGIAHRDVKPSNILVQSDHRKGVYLCDFGLGRDLDVATPAQLRDGAGSPLYMAPERLLRQAADEVRGDIYALGVTLFEALMLVPPLSVPPDLPRAFWTTHLTTTPPLLPSEVWPTIPPKLEAVICRATAREPSRRYASAGELAFDLQRLAVRQPPARTWHQLCH